MGFHRLNDYLNNLSLREFIELSLNDKNSVIEYFWHQNHNLIIK